MALLRQDRMTKDERMRALLKRQPLDRIPVYGLIGGFAALNIGRTVEDIYGDFTGEVGYQAFEWTTEQYGLQDLHMVGYLQLGVLECGGDIALPTGEFAQATMVTRYPVTTEDEGWKLELPDVKQAGIIPGLMERSKALEKSGAQFLALLLPGPWEFASYMCGIERVCRWAMKKPELVHRLLRLGKDFILDLAHYWVDSFDPARFLVFSTHAQTSNQIISPKMFQEFCLPYIKDVHQRVLAMGYDHILCHICGEQNLNLPYWAQIPMGNPGIASFGHEVDLENASKYFPNDIIMGNVEPAVIQMGRPEQVYELTGACIEKGRKHPGGFMLGLGCEMPPLAPSYNVWTMMKAVSDLGWYD